MDNPVEPAFMIRIQYSAYVSSAVNHSIINICMLGHDRRELWEGLGCIIFRLEWLMAEDINSRNTRNCVASTPLLFADDICVLGCPKFAIEENPKRLIHYGGQSKLIWLAASSRCASATRIGAEMLLSGMHYCKRRWMWRWLHVSCSSSCRLVDVVVWVGETWNTKPFIEDSLQIFVNRYSSNLSSRPDQQRWARRRTRSDDDFVDTLCATMAWTL